MHMCIDIYTHTHTHTHIYIWKPRKLQNFKPIQFPSYGDLTKSHF